MPWIVVIALSVFLFSQSPPERRVSWWLSLGLTVTYMEIFYICCSASNYSVNP